MINVLLSLTCMLGLWLVLSKLMILCKPGRISQFCSAVLCLVAPAGCRTLFDSEGNLCRTTFSKM